MSLILRVAEIRTAKTKTYKEAQAELVEYLEGKRWKFSGWNLRVPYATSPDGDIRLWFKAQAVYVSSGPKHKFGDARSVPADVKRDSPEKVVSEAERFAEAIWGR